jgi:hypothetical protein
MGVGATIILFLFVFACLLTDLPAALVQARCKQEERLDSAKTHTRFFLQESVGRRMRAAQIQWAIVQGIVAKLEAFCKQWNADHAEKQEVSYASNEQ